MKHYNYSKAKDNYYSLTVKHITITATLGSLILSLPSFFFLLIKNLWTWKVNKKQFSLVIRKLLQCQENANKIYSLNFAIKVRNFA